LADLPQPDGWNVCLEILGLRTLDIRHETLHSTRRGDDRS